MPKKSLKIDKFEGGIVDYYNPRDIPENSLVEAQDVMVDVLGKIRLMGTYNTYIVGDQPATDLLAQCNPGYGLYTFSADYNMANESQEIEMLAIQRHGTIGVFDSALNEDQIVLTADNTSEMGPKCEPVFFYTNGALRISDGYIEDVTAENTQSHDEIDNRWFGYINRTLFSELGTTIDRALGWTDELQELVTPTVDAQNALLDVTPNAGTISIKPTWVADSEEGEWNASQLDNLTFGYSWLYDDEKQESKVALFQDDIDVTSSVDYALELQVFIDNTGFSSIPNRVTGFRIYWMGEGGDLFEDPFQLAEGDFVKGTLTGHNNTVVNFSVSGDYYVTPAAGASPLTLPTQPALTFRLVNGYKHDIDSITARYKNVVVANGVSYIGNIRQNDTNYHDRMLKSAIGPDGKGFFDVFPSDNFLDVAVQDGDAITALEEFADRLLQFKRKSMYIINISGDFEYVESHHLYMGVDHPSAVTKIAAGIAWVNENGCYIFDGESATNLITNKLSPIEWKRFVGKTGMIGYIGPRQQLIIAGTFRTTEGPQNIYIYDLRTGSWTMGVDKIPSNSKSNFSSQYKNTMLFASNMLSAEESMDVRDMLSPQPYTNGEWILPDLHGLDFVSTQLKINSIPVTNVFSHSNEGSDQTIQEKIANEILSGPYAWALQCNAVGNPIPLGVSMPGYLNDDTSGNLSGNNSPMVFDPAPTRAIVSQTYTSSLTQLATDTLNPDASLVTPCDVTISAMSEFGSHPNFAEVATEEGHDNGVNGQELSFHFMWGEGFTTGAIQNSSRSGYIVAEASGYWIGLKAAKFQGYDLSNDNSKTSGIKLSGFNQTESYLGNVIDSSLWNNTMLYPALQSSEGGGCSIPQGGDYWQRCGMYDAVNMSWQNWTNASHYGNSKSCYMWGISQVDIGLACGDKIVISPGSTYSGSNPDLGFQHSSLRIDNVTKNGQTYLAISYPRQIGGDLASQYTSAAKYNSICDAIAQTSQEWSLTTTSDSVLNGKSLITIDSFTDNSTDDGWGSSDYSSSYPGGFNGPGGSLALYVENGNCWYKAQTIIVKENGVNNSLITDSKTFHEPFTVASLAGTFVVFPPITVAVPNEGHGARKIIVPKRNEAQDAEADYRAEIISSTGQSTALTYTTNVADNPVEIIEGLSQLIEGETLSAMNIKSADKVEMANLSIEIKVDTAVYTIEGAGLVAAGFTDDMEVELVASSGSSHSNDGSRFLITSVASGSPDILTINPAINDPYNGLSAPVAQGAKSYNLNGGAILVQDINPQPYALADFTVATSVENGKVVIHEFTNSSNNEELSINNSSSGIRILTKEFDFGDLSKKKNINALYISHSDHEKMKVQYIINGSTSQEISPENSEDTNSSLHTVKYLIQVKGIRTFQVLLTSKESITNYEINDISIVYRDRPSR